MTVDDDVVFAFVLGTKIGGGDGISAHLVEVSRLGIDVQADPVLGAVGNFTIVGCLSVLISDGD